MLSTGAFETGSYSTRFLCTWEEGGVPGVVRGVISIRMVIEHNT
jgi:hypothetical protein